MVDPLYALAQKMPTSRDYYVVAGHGNPRNILSERFQAPLSPAKAAAAILRDPNYKKGTTVKLMTCHSGISPGDSQPSYAQLLAQELTQQSGVKTNVLGATNWVWWYTNGASAVAQSNHYK